MKFGKKTSATRRPSGASTDLDNALSLIKEASDRARYATHPTTSAQVWADSMRPALVVLKAPTFATAHQVLRDLARTSKGETLRRASDALVAFTAAAQHIHDLRVKAKAPKPKAKAPKPKPKTEKAKAKPKTEKAKKAKPKAPKAEKAKPKAPKPKA
jgi:hypothetical protein